MLGGKWPEDGYDAWIGLLDRYGGLQFMWEEADTQLVEGDDAVFKAPWSASAGSPDYLKCQGKRFAITMNSDGLWSENCEKDLNYALC